MLAAPNIHKPSKLPTILIAVALASAVAYFAFFRHKPEAPPAPPSPAPAAAAAPARVEPAVAAEAPKPEPARREAPKKVVAPAPPPVAVSFAPPARSLKTEVDELIAEGRWRDARAKVAAGFSGPLPDAERIELAQAGARINQELLQTRADDKDVELYEIQQGDTLESIAKKYKALNGVKG